MNRAMGGVLSVVALVGLVGCGGSGAGKATPEATFESFKTSMKNKDYKGAFAHVAPDSQAMALGGMAIIIGMAKQDPKVGPEAAKLLEKHSIKELNPVAIMMAAAGGSNPEAEIRKSVADTKDKPAAFEDVILWLEKNAPQAPGEGNPMQRMSDAVLTDVKIENDVATGTVKMKGSDGNEESQPAKFRKIDGAWLIEFDTSGPGGPPASSDQPLGETPGFTPGAVPDLPTDGLEGQPGGATTVPQTDGK